MRLDFKSALRLLLLAESICVYGSVSSSKAYGKDKFELVFIKENRIHISLVPSQERLIMHCWTVFFTLLLYLDSILLLDLDTVADWRRFSSPTTLKS